MRNSTEGHLSGGEKSNLLAHIITSKDQNDDSTSGILNL